MKKKIIILGTRGIPDIPGGVESHCEELYPRLVQNGYDVTLIRRSEYLTSQHQEKTFKGVLLKNIYCPRKKSYEAIVHTFLGILYSRKLKPDLLHIHAVGPSLLIPFARLLGLKVVMTNHGPDYDRQKWGKAAKLILKTGEIMGSLFANKIIVISEVIKKIVADNYGKESELIYNGVQLPNRATNTDYIDYLGLRPRKYVIAVGRFVEEKGFLDLISAWKSIQSDHHLVMVGDTDYEDEYSLKLKKMAVENGVIRTGYIKGEKLKQIFSHAIIFVLPSYHEGLPIALLEAMSYNLKILASDIPANLAVKLEPYNYFKTGDIKDLTEKLSHLMSSSIDPDYTEIIRKKYNWDIIARHTAKVYKNIING